MRVETKFLRLFNAVAVGDHIDGWRVCWVGGWDKCRVLFVVMVEREIQGCCEITDSSTARSVFGTGNVPRASRKPSSSPWRHAGNKEKA
jgi:hypothetical protein